jgi:translation elongation factor EF-4
VCEAYGTCFTSTKVRRCTSTTVQILTQRSPQDIIPRQQFKVPIQAKIGEKIVASAQVLTLLAVLALLVQKYEYTDAG